MATSEQAEIRDLQDQMGYLERQIKVLILTLAQKRPNFEADYKAFEADYKAMLSRF